MNQFDGILGLAPEQINGPITYMAALSRNHTLDKFMFSMYIGDANETSDITFGGYDSFKIKKDDDEGYGIHWYEVELD